MTPNEFVEAWNIQYPSSKLIKAELPDLVKFPQLKVATIDMLTVGGLPDAFGELNFDYLNQPIKSVNKLWDLGEPFFDDFVAIGFNGSGDPIAIKLRDNDSFIYLNHDNNFQEIFINSSIVQFTETILRIGKFYLERKDLTPTSLYTTEFSDEEYHLLLNDLRKIDTRIFNEENSHWIFTLEYDLWERNEHRKNNGS